MPRKIRYADNAGSGNPPRYFGKREAEVTFPLSGTFLFLPLSAVIIRGEYREAVRQSDYSELKVSVTRNHPYPRVCGGVDDDRERCGLRRRKKKRKERGKQVFRPFPAHTTGITATRTGTKYFHYAAMYFTGAYFVRRFCSIWIVNHDFLFSFPVSYAGRSSFSRNGTPFEISCVLGWPRRILVELLLLHPVSRCGVDGASTLHDLDKLV